MLLGTATVLCLAAVVRGQGAPNPQRNVNRFGVTPDQPSCGDRPSSAKQKKAVRQRERPQRYR